MDRLEYGRLRWKLMKNELRKALRAKWRRFRNGGRRREEQLEFGFRPPFQTNSDHREI